MRRGLVAAAISREAGACRHRVPSRRRHRHRRAAAFQKVGEQLNQQFVIDNRAAAGGTIGAALVAKSLPDGYTVMVYSATLVANQHLYKKLPYDALKDFVGITPVSRLVAALVVHPSMPVRTTKELISLALARPGDISYGSAGVGAFQHLSTSMFASMADVNMVHVPYKGGAPRPSPSRRARFR